MALFFLQFLFLPDTCLGWSFPYLYNVTIHKRSLNWLAPLCVNINQINFRFIKLLFLKTKNENGVKNINGLSEIGVNPNFNSDFKIVVYEYETGQFTLHYRKPVNTNVLMFILNDRYPFVRLYWVMKVT